MAEPTITQLNNPDADPTARPVKPTTVYIFFYLSQLLDLHIPPDADKARSVMIWLQVLALTVLRHYWISSILPNYNTFYHELGWLTEPPEITRNYAQHKITVTYRHPGPTRRAASLFVSVTPDGDITYSFFTRTTARRKPCPPSPST